MQSQQVTHVHCPPPVDGMAGLVSGQDGRSASEQQQPCWTANGASFCVGEAAGAGLHIIDFHASLHSPCHVGERASRPRLSPFAIPTPCPVCPAQPWPAVPPQGLSYSMLQTVLHPLNFVKCWHVCFVHNHEHEHKYTVATCNVISGRKVCSWQQKWCIQ